MGNARQRDSARAAGLWSPVAAPYTSLREALADAERLLNSPATAASTPLWSRFAEVADDVDQVAEATDALLAANVLGWRLGEDDGRSTIMLTGRTGLGVTELAAVQAFALLVESGGTGRPKRCRRGGCAAVFLDWTNAGIRRLCRAHGWNPR